MSKTKYPVIDIHCVTKENQDKILQEKVSPPRQKEIEDKLKQLGILGPGYIRNMMDNDMKGVEISFLE